jgi:anti-sigma factor RsiW
MTDPVREFELEAYMDGELCLERRLAVEDHLSRQPAAAARLMADLHCRTALRLLHGSRGAPPPPMIDAAGRLERRLQRPSIRRWLPPARRMSAAAAVLTLFALLAVPQREVVASPPAYISEALMAYRTGLLRESMSSFVETPHYDRSEVLRRTRIRVPRLPAGWQITDVQLFPSDLGPALQLMVRTASGQSASIFAVRADSAAPHDPVAIRRGSRSVAYWRAEDISYAMIGAEAPEVMDLAATSLAGQPAE